MNHWDGQAVLGAQAQPEDRALQCTGLPGREPRDTGLFQEETMELGKQSVMRTGATDQARNGVSGMLCARARTEARRHQSGI